MFPVVSRFIIIASLVASAIFAGLLFLGDKGIFLPDNRINGLNLVATRNSLTSEEIKDVSKVNTNWVSVIPYAFSRKNEARVQWDFSRQWYGETTSGAAESISVAKDVGYKVMLKPHVWVIGDGWPGEFKLENEADWKIWERDYHRYILTYAQMADSLDVEMLCIGTEYRHAVKDRPLFWNELIASVRKIYNGKLTYAANWDNYENVPFWDELDFIGIDAYFPLSKDKRPDTNALMENWKWEKEKLEKFAHDQMKPILFTEYGYQSVEYGCMGHWEQADDPRVDMVVQKNAYEALYRTFWLEPWFAGGFLWKWHPDHENAGGIDNTRFTPQNKHAQLVVAKWYGKK